MLTEKRRQEILEWTDKGQIDLQLWLEEHEPEDSYLWKESWWKRNILIRDRILRVLFGYDYKIVGSHLSKSIECPVILVKNKDVDIILQYNFYDWQIMIKSEKPLILEDLDLYSATGNYFYYQGIPDEYCFKKYDEVNNNKEFGIDIKDDLYDVYAFMIMLKKTIDRSYSLLK